jgi:predicted ribosomally synthesized six-cysteine peptide SCIFF
MEKKHIITLNPEAGDSFGEETGCGECPTSCQSACKTSCTVGNQVCIRESEKK